jgi:hypothetical protein
MTENSLQIPVSQGISKPGRVRRDRSPKFNLARATKRTYNLGQCHRQFSQREKPKHVSAPCPQNYKRRPGNWTPVGRIGEPRKSIRGKEMNITDPIYADEDKAREHLESIQFHQSVAS